MLFMEEFECKKAFRSMSYKADNMFPKDCTVKWGYFVVVFFLFTVTLGRDCFRQNLILSDEDTHRCLTFGLLP